MRDTQPERTAADLAADPRRLDRDELIALVERLQTLADRQQATIVEQAAELAGRRPNGGAPQDFTARAPSSSHRHAELLEASRHESASRQDGQSARTTRPLGFTRDDGGETPRRAAKPVGGFDYTIVFDGGSLGNPGKGYGSFQIVDRTGVVAAERLDFGDGVTNNQAEFRTLIRALETLREHLGGGAPASVAVRGDSQLVINTVNGSWKARHPELIPLRDRAVALLRGFSRTDVAWQRRSASVRVLGH